jgi:hypothetical protein
VRKSHPRRRVHLQPFGVGSRAVKADRKLLAHLTVVAGKDLPRLVSVPTMAVSSTSYPVSSLTSRATVSAMDSQPGLLG